MKRSLWGFWQKHKCKVHNHYQMTCYWHLEVYVAVLYNTISFSIVVKHLRINCLHVKTAGSLPKLFDKTRFETRRKNESENIWRFLYQNYAQINLLFQCAFCFNWLVNRHILILLRCILLSCKNTAYFCIALWCKA